MTQRRGADLLEAQQRGNDAEVCKRGSLQAGRLRLRRLLGSCVEQRLCYLHKARLIVEPIVFADSLQEPCMKLTYLWCRERPTLIYWAAANFALYRWHPT